MGASDLQCLKRDLILLGLDFGRGASGFYGWFLFKVFGELKKVVPMFPRSKWFIFMNVGLGSDTNNCH